MTLCHLIKCGRWDEAIDMVNAGTADPYAFDEVR